MQMAVDIVSQSAHPTSKVAATVFGSDHQKEPFYVARTNYYPAAFIDVVPIDEKIGNSSPTVHAETAALMNVPVAEGASICVTDLFCPNCAKNITEAGIHSVYIDHKGYEKDFAARRIADFESMSIALCKRAGVNVYKIFRKEKRMETIHKVSDDFILKVDSPVQIEDVAALSEAVLDNVVKRYAEKHKNRKFVAALALSPDGECKAIIARAHPAIGYIMREDRALMEKQSGKYNFMLEPMNRLLMNAARYGLHIQNGYVFSAQVPTSREQVNMLGAGINEYRIGNIHKARDNYGLLALEYLTGAGMFAIK